MASIIKADIWQTTSGVQNSAVLQVVDTFYSVPTSQSFTGGVTLFTDVLGLSASITPRSVTSRILIFVRWWGEISSQVEIYNTMWSLRRNGTVIGLPNQPGSLCIGIHSASISYYGNDNDSTPEMMNFHYVDSPATTSPVTYQVCLSCHNSVTFYTNREVNAATSGGYERGTSGITLMEIAV